MQREIVGDDLGRRDDRRHSGKLTPHRQLRALEVIDARLGAAIGVADLARACNLSPSRFAYSFKQTTGMSPHRWLTMRRIARAKELLGTADTTLAQVALAAGFADQSHFTHVFTAEVGIPPGEWRRRGTATCAMRPQTSRDDAVHE